MYKYHCPKISILERKMEFSATVHFTRSLEGKIVVPEEHNYGT